MQKCTHNDVNRCEACGLCEYCHHEWSKVGEEKYIICTTAKIVADRLEHLRAQIEQECISYGEIAELQSLAEHIEPGDVQLLEWANVPEIENPRIQFSAGYGGRGVNCDVYLNDKRHVIDIQDVEQMIKKAMFTRGYTVSKTARQKYPRISIND